MTSIAVSNDNEYYWLADTAGQPIGTLRPVESVADVQELADRESKRHRQQLCVYRVRLVAVGDWIDYHEYIRSDEWREKADAAKERADHRCQVCYSPDQLDAHHRTYERLGNELPSDITVLCRNCHTTFHQRRKLNRTPDPVEEPQEIFPAVDAFEGDEYMREEPEPGPRIVSKDEIDKRLSQRIVEAKDEILEVIRLENERLPALVSCCEAWAVSNEGTLYMGFGYPILQYKFEERPEAVGIVEKAVHEVLSLSLRVQPVLTSSIEQGE